MFGYRLVQPAACLAAVLWSLAAPACNVPVFRYALERWEADPYQVVVFHREPLTAEQQAQLQTLEKEGQLACANLLVDRVDLALETRPLLRTLWNAQENPATPWMVVRYPRRTGIEPSVWAGPLSAETVKSLLESPARRDIAGKLLGGDAVVWLLLECGNKSRDNEAGRLVETEIRKLEQLLVLPERSPLDPPITSALPLRIAFSMVRVARSNPGERMLVNLLLNWNTNLLSAEEPMLFPIFGRGRVVPPAIGPQIRPEAIRDMAEFLTGPCSCEVKELNPGYDLLLAAEWTSLPGYEEVAVAPLPLVGMSEFAAGAATNPAAPSHPTTPALAVASPGPPPAKRDHLVRNLLVLLGVGAIFLAAATFALKVKANGRLR